MHYSSIMVVTQQRQLGRPRKKEKKQILYSGMFAKGSRPKNALLADMPTKAFRHPPPTPLALTDIYEKL